MSAAGRHHVAAAALVLGLLALRLTDIGANPKGFFCDEASIAFNARAILEDGRDEHGARWPIYFESFGDYKFGLYVYAAAASVAVLGEGHLATRLPAALFLAGFTAATYLLLARAVHPWCGLLGLVLAASEPWLHHFSHVAFSLTAVPLLLALALHAWLRGVDAWPGWLLVAALLFALAFHAYSAGRVLVPPLFVGLLWIDRERLVEPRRRRALLGALLVAAVCSIPFLRLLGTRTDFLDRPRYLSVLTTPWLNDLPRYTALVGELGGPESAVVTALGERGMRAGLFVTGYGSSLAPGYLLVSGDDNLRFGTPRFGAVGVLTGVGLGAWLLSLVRRRRRLDRILLWWLVLYPLPGALTWEDVPHSGRNIAGYPALAWIAALGLWRAGGWLRRRAGRGALAAAVVVASIAWSATTGSYLRYYRDQHSRLATGWMQYGYADMMRLIERHHGDYRRVRLVVTGLHYVPYVFALYESGMAPSEWRAGRTLPWGIEVQTWPLDPDDWRPDELYVLAPPETIPRGARRLEEVRWEDGGTVAFALYDRPGSLDE